MVFEDLLRELGSSEYPELRPTQSKMLAKYERLLTAGGAVPKNDAAIEMPSGAGKTLVELLVAEYFRRRKQSVVILTGTKQLAHQVQEDSRDLGVDTVLFEGRGATWSQADLQKYRSARAVAIMNYWAYFNSSPRPSPPHVLIFDDAHLAEGPIGDMFSVSVDKSLREDLFNQIIDLVITSAPNRYAALVDIRRHDLRPKAPTLVTFFDWLRIREAVLPLLDTAAKEEDAEDGLRFTWSGLRNAANALAMYVTHSHIHFRPIVYPSQDIGHFSKPTHRLYLTATFGDPQDFRRRLGLPDLTFLRPDDPEPAERGRRFVVFFPSREDGLDREKVLRTGTNLLWPAARRRLWLCSSRREAEQWKAWVPPLKGGTTDHIFELRGGAEDQLEKFLQARLGHLFVAGRYDGIDFPGDQCRLAFIPSPPVATDVQEEFFSTHLRDAKFLKSRFSQRVAQALGRCNRNSADFATYVFLDSKFERYFGGNDPEYLELLPQDIQPEIEAALAAMDSGFGAVCQEAAHFLFGQFDSWDRRVEEFAESRHSGLVPSENVETVNHEIAGWLALWRGDAARAAKIFEKWESSLDASGTSGPLAFARYARAWAEFRCHAELGDQTAVSRAASFMEAAAWVGPSSWFTAIVRSAGMEMSQRTAPRPSTRTVTHLPPYSEAILEAWESLLFEKGTKPQSLVRSLDSIAESLVSPQHDRVAEAMVSLGEFVGFESYRPAGQGVTDAVWKFSFGPKLVFSFEVKAELDGRPVAQRDIDQAHGQGRVISDSFAPDGYSCHSFIVASTDRLEPGLVSRLGNVRCVKQQAFHETFTQARSLFQLFQSLWSPNDGAKRQEARNAVFGRLPKADWLAQCADGAIEGFVSENCLKGSWSTSSSTS